jgi:Putative transposase
VLDYLARYVFSIAITNARLVGLDEHAVTIRYKQRKAARWRTCPIAGEEFMRRFLQHVLPKGFHKVRYFGLWHPANRELAARVRLRPVLDQPQAPTAAALGNLAAPDGNPTTDQSAQPTPCPQCQIGQLVLIRRLTPQKPMAP